MARWFRGLCQNRDDIASPYTITLGDEFQAVYRKPGRIFRDILAIQAMTYPVKVRFAVGVGELTTSLNRRSSIGMDGPAFYAAREGLTRLKKLRRLYCIMGDTSNPSSMVDEVLALVSHEVSTWKKNRLTIAVHLFDGMEPQGIARELRVSRAAIYKNIKAGAIPAIIALLEKVGEILDDRGGAP